MNYTPMNHLQKRSEVAKEIGYPNLAYYTTYVHSKCHDSGFIVFEPAAQHHIDDKVYLCP